MWTLKLAAGADAVLLREKQGVQSNPGVHLSMFSWAVYMP